MTSYVKIANDETTLKHHQVYIILTFFQFVVSMMMYPMEVDHINSLLTISAICVDILSANNSKIIAMLQKDTTL
jgi:cytosine/uracil/thiamine/allantoin permease